MTSTSFTSNPPTKQLDWVIHSYEMTQRVSFHPFIGRVFRWITMNSRRVHGCLIPELSTTNLQRPRSKEGTQRQACPSSPLATLPLWLETPFELWASCVRGTRVTGSSESKRKRGRGGRQRNYKGNEVCRKNIGNKIRLIFHRILQLFSTLVKVLE